MKMDRLFEWQRDLTEKLGVTIQELKEVPLPSEEELDRLKEHLVILQAERDKRAEIFLNTQMEIKEIMGEFNTFVIYLQVILVTHSGHCLSEPNT